MTEKLEFYDLLGILVPGTLAVCIIAFSFPEFSRSFSVVVFPEVFSVIALTAVAVFFGQLVQALSGLLEPFYDWTWSGRPSERAISVGLGDRYLPSVTASRIRSKLLVVCEPNPSDRSLFLRAMQLAENSSSSRVGRFNALYAYHRSLLTLVVIALLTFSASVVLRSGRNWDFGNRWVLFVAMCGLVLLIWNRARQRGIYYVREVLFAAEYVLDKPRDMEP